MKKIQIYVENIEDSEIDKQIILFSNSLSGFFDITIVSLGNIKNEIVLNKKIKLIEFNFNENNGYLSNLKIKNNISKFIKNNASDIIISTSLNINKILTQINISSELIYWKLDNNEIKLEHYRKYFNGIKKIVFTNAQERDKYTFDDREVFIISPSIDSVTIDYEYSELKNILYMGSLDDEDNIKDLVTIMKLVKEENPDIKLNIIGDGNKRIEMIKYVKNNNVQDNIIFHGLLDSNEIDYELKRTALFLNLEDSVVSNIKLIEAMNYGIPAISYYNETLKNIIENDINGYLIKEHNLQEFADKILLVFSSKENLENMRLCARETSMFYEINSIKSEWLKIL